MTVPVAVLAVLVGDRRLDRRSPGSGTRSATGSTRSRSARAPRARRAERRRRTTLTSVLAVVARRARHLRRLGVLRRPPPAGAARAERPARRSSTSSGSTRCTTPSSTGRPSRLARRAATLGRGAAHRRLDHGHLVRARGARAAPSAKPRPATSAATRSRSPPRSPSSSSSSSRCNDDRADPPPARRRRSSSGCCRCRAARSGALALLAALAELVLWVVAVAGFDFDTGLQLEDRQSWFSDLGVSYHVGFFGFSLWLAGLTIVVCDGRDRLRALGGPRAGARLLRAAALPDRRDRRRLRLAGPAPLLRLLRGDADPALRADRRLGRAAAGRARR